MLSIYDIIYNVHNIRVLLLLLLLISYRFHSITRFIGYYWYYMYTSRACRPRTHLYIYIHIPKYIYIFTYLKVKTLHTTYHIQLVSMNITFIVSVYIFMKYISIEKKITFKTPCCII